MDRKTQFYTSTVMSPAPEYLNSPTCSFHDVLCLSLISGPEIDWNDLPRPYEEIATLFEIPFSRLLLLVNLLIMLSTLSCHCCVAEEGRHSKKQWVSSVMSFGKQAANCHGCDSVWLIDLGGKALSLEFNMIYKWALWLSYWVTMPTTSNISC